MTMDLEDLRAACATCQQCPLGATRMRSVFSDGNPAGRLMVIGEGPGQREDETGTPFVGKAGQLLTQILAAGGFDRARDVYVANIVKCRPPGNRVPSPEEMQACMPFLRRQVAIVRPKIILLAGATALQGFLGRSGISRWRGQWFPTEDGAWVMPIFHPAFLLRNDARQKGSPKWLMWQDIQAVRARYDALAASAVEIP